VDIGNQIVEFNSETTVNPLVISIALLVSFDENLVEVVLWIDCVVKRGLGERGAEVPGGAAAGGVRGAGERAVPPGRAARAGGAGARGAHAVPAAAPAGRLPRRPPVRLGAVDRAPPVWRQPGRRGRPVQPVSGFQTQMVAISSSPPRGLCDNPVLNLRCLQSLLLDLLAVLLEFEHLVKNQGNLRLNLDGDIQDEPVQVF